MELKIGTSLQNGKYVIKNVLGKSETCITYLVTTQQNFYGTTVDVPMVVKESFLGDYCQRNPDSGELGIISQDKVALVCDLVYKFCVEAQTFAELQHPNILQIVDCFEENGTYYYAMPFVQEGSIVNYLKNNGNHSVEDSINYVKQIADALSYIHHLNHCHYNIKPNNIFIDSQGKALLSDFGINRNLEDNPMLENCIVGIDKNYAPIEQLNGSYKEFSPETDIYSLAGILYTLLTGKLVPPANYIQNVGLGDAPENVSLELWNVLEKSLSPQINERPHSAEQFVQMITEATPANTQMQQIQQIADTEQKEVVSETIENKESEPDAIVKNVPVSIPVAETEPEPIAEPEPAPIEDREVAPIAEIIPTQVEETETTPIAEDELAQIQEPEPTPIVETTPAPVEVPTPEVETGTIQIEETKFTQPNDCETKQEPKVYVEDKPASQPIQTIKEDLSKSQDIYEPQQATKPKSKEALYIGIAAAAVVMIGVIFGFVSGKKGNTSTTIPEESNIEATVENPEVSNVAETVQSVTKEKLKTNHGKCTYTGEVDGNGVPNGQGSAKYDNGTYSGQFIDGKHVDASGEATMKFKNGDKYKGTFVDDHFDEGTYTWANGYRYVGTFKASNNNKDGDYNNGTLYDNKGEKLNKYNNGEMK